MPDGLYSLWLAPAGPTGEFRAAPSTGGGWFAAPLGGGYSDVFRKDPAPTPRELVRQFVGIGYACADLNALSVASLKCRVYRKTSTGEQRRKWRCQPVPPSRKSYLQKTRANDLSYGNDDLEEITDESNPLVALLANPDPWDGDCGLSSFDQFYMTEVFLELMGRSYWYIGERDGIGNLKKCPLLRSHLMREVPDPTGKRVISHYEYGGATGITFAPEDIAKFHFPDPFNPHLNGFGPMQAAIEKIRIGRKQDAHINALLENMGRPDAIWSPKGDSEGGGISMEEASRVRHAIKGQFAQAGRGSVMVSEYPGNLEVLGWKPQDVVELERTKQLELQVMNCFGVPDAKLHRNAANLASAKTADAAHGRDTIVPRCKRMEAVINDRIVPMFDDSGRLFVAFDNPVPDDDVFQLDMTRTGAEMGIAKVNESRAALGLAPIDGPAGECIAINSNMVFIKPDGTVLESALPPNSGNSQPSDDDNPGAGKKKPKKDGKSWRAELARAM